MKKIVIGLLLFLFVAVIVWLRVNPPLETGSVGRNDERTSFVIGIGNKGFGDIKITEVKVNNGETPSEVTMQIHSPEQAMILAHNLTESEASSYKFYKLKDAKIKKGSSIGELYEKQDKNQVEKDDKVYGLTIVNGKPVDKVEIKYWYLGMPYKTEMELK